MVIGDGFLGKKFQNKYSLIDDVIIFASGVSDSTIDDESQFNKEVELLSETINSLNKKKLVYFSTISIFDQFNLTPYIKHKINCEKIITDNVEDYFIFRLPQIFGNGGNSKNLFNYLKNSILEDREIIIWNEAKRYVLDIDDAYNIIDYCLENRLQKINNIFGIEEIDAIKLIRILETCFNKKAKILILDKISNFSITKNDTKFIEDIIFKLKINKQNYTTRIVEKIVMIEFIQSLYVKYKDNEDIQRLMQCEIIDFLKTSVVEIGSNEGYSTQKFCEECQKSQKTVLSIDPFNGQQQGDERVYLTFKQNILEKYKNINFLRKESQSEEAKSELKSINYKYCFVDGLHTEDASFSDLNNVWDTIEEGGVVCLDDTNVDGIKKSMEKAISQGKFMLVPKPITIIYPKHKTFEFLIKL
jgi:hypothetical protein